MGKALMPGKAAILGASSRAISMVVRSRSSQALPRMITLPWATDGLPTMVKMRSNSGMFWAMPSMASAYLRV